ncbi:MAG: RNA methyltransferase PUA domain-containing protein, partial [Gemmatimonadaceae bacterium]
MVELRDRATVATFFAADGALVVGATVTLGEETARHMTVRRMATGEPVQLVDGAGHVADATLIRLARGGATAQIEALHAVAPLPPLHLLAPIADRDRML